MDWARSVAMPPASRNSDSGACGREGEERAEYRLVRMGCRWLSAVLDDAYAATCASPSDDAP